MGMNSAITAQAGARSSPHILSVSERERESMLGARFLAWEDHPAYGRELTLLRKRQVSLRAGGDRLGEASALARASEHRRF